MGRRGGWIAAVSALASVALWTSACSEKAAERGEGAIVPDEQGAKLASTDPLWALAPSGLELGVVVADGSVATLQAALATAVDVLERSLETEPFGHLLRQQLTVAGLSLIDARLGDVGIDLARGAALFVGESGPVLVLPVADRAKLVAALGGTSEGGVDRLRDGLSCKPVAGRYVCAHAAEQLDRLGQGGPSPVASWTSDMRGHVEIYTSTLPPPVQELTEPAGLVMSQGIRIGARLERGAATVRVHVAGQLVEPLAAAGASGRSRLATGMHPAPAGLFVVKGAGLWRAFGEKAVGALPAAMLVGDVSLGELVASFDGDAVGWAIPGDTGRSMIRIGLANETPMRKLLAACDELGGALPPAIKIVRRGDRCTITADAQLVGPQQPDARPLTAALWVDSGAVNIELDGLVKDAAAGPPAKPELPAFAREVIDDSPLFATWGRGTFLGSQSILSPTDLKNVPDGDVEQSILAMMLRVSEVGISLRARTDGIHAAFRLRTLWANPDPLVTEIENAIDELSTEKPEARAHVAALAGRFPDSPFARDLRGGSGGLALQTVPVIALGALAVWAERRAHEKRPWMAPITGGALGSAPSDSEPPAPSGPVTPACAKVARSLDAWMTGAVMFRSKKPKPYWSWDSHQGLAPPTVDRGWREFDGKWLAVIIGEDGIYLELPDDPAMGKRYPSVEVMAEALAAAARKVRRVVLIADGTQPAMFARDVRNAVPREVPVALAVRMPASVIVERFTADVRGRVPPESARAMELSLEAVREESWAPLATGLRLAIDHAGECTPGVRAAMNKLRQGGGIDIIGPGLADAFRACNCRAADVDGVITAAAFASAGIVGRGWIPMWRRDDSRWSTVRGMDLDQLAGNLLSGGASRSP